MAKRRDKVDAQTEREITIPPRNNAVVVQIKGQSWIAIFRGYEEIMREGSPRTTVSFQLPPGDYTLRTDGAIEAVSFETVTRPALPGLPADAVSALDRALIEGRPISAGQWRQPLSGAPTVGDLPPDLLQRVLRYAEVDGKTRLDRETVNRIVSTGKLPDHVRLPAGLLERAAGRPPVEESVARTTSRPPAGNELVSMPVMLEVMVEAPGRNPVDGMPEVPADGQAACTIRVSKRTATGQALNRADDKDDIYLRTTGGQLVNEAGKPLRTLRLNKGVASFRLISEAAPRMVTVSILSPTLPKVDVKIDFVLSG